MLGIAKYKPNFFDDANLFLKTQKDKFEKLIGKSISRFWIMWDEKEDEWYPDGPVILEIDNDNYEFCAYQLDDIQAMFDELFSMESLGFSGYSTVASNISSIEESVYNDSDYNSSERDIVLQVGAMLRHSLAYWVNVAETPTHPRHGDDEITGPIGVAFADAKAFLEDLIFNDTNGRPKDVARYASNMYANTHG